MLEPKAPNWSAAARQLYAIQQQVLRRMGASAVDFYRAKAGQVGLVKTGNLRKQIKFRMTPTGIIIRAGAKQSRIHNVGGRQLAKTVDVQAHTRAGRSVPAHQRQRGEVRYRQRGFMYVREDLLVEAERELMAQLERALFG